MPFSRLFVLEHWRAHNKTNNSSSIREIAHKLLLRTWVVGFDDQAGRTDFVEQGHCTLAAVKRNRSSLDCC